MFLMQKTGDFSIIGSIFFEDDRVSELVSSLKATGSKDTSDFVLALYRSVLSGRDRATETVTITASSKEMGNGTSRYVILTYPNGRVLRISQAAVHGAAGVARCLACNGATSMSA